MGFYGSGRTGLKSGEKQAKIKWIKMRGGKRKTRTNLVFMRVFWRRGRDSNPREIALKLISSQPRYDRFDTSPYIILPQKRENAI